LSNFSSTHKELEVRVTAALFQLSFRRGHSYRWAERVFCQMPWTQTKCPLHFTKWKVNYTCFVMKPQHEIRNLVRRHRRLAEMTQQQLAERIGVTRQTILSIEKGKYTPSVALALALSSALNVSVETLFQLKAGRDG
jgi:putative transcriptional regulator